MLKEASEPSQTLAALGCVPITGTSFTCCDNAELVLVLKLPSPAYTAVILA